MRRAIPYEATRHKIILGVTGRLMLADPGRNICEESTLEEILSEKRSPKLGRALRPSGIVTLLPRREKGDRIRTRGRPVESTNGGKRGRVRKTPKKGDIPTQRLTAHIALVAKHSSGRRLRNYATAALLGSAH